MGEARVIVLGCALAASGCQGGGGESSGTDGGTTAAMTMATPSSGELSTSGTGTGAGVDGGPCHLLAPDWTVEVIPVTGPPQHARMVFEAGEPAVAWVRGGAYGDRLHLSSRAGGVWTHEELRGSGSGMGVPGLTFDADGVPHLLYGWRHSLGGSVELAARRDGAWEEIAFVSERDSLTSSLATAADGSILGVFHQLWEMQEVFAEGDGWAQAIVDDATMAENGGKASAGVGNDLTVDADGMLHASYVDAGGAVYHNRKSGGVWERRTVTATGADTELTAIALDGAGGIHIAYRGEDDEALMLATPEGAGWSVAALEAGEGGGRAAQLEIDGAGVRHVAHFRSGADDIRYANDGSGAFEFVSIAADVASGALAMARDDDDVVWLVWGVEEQLCLGRPS